MKLTYENKVAINENTDIPDINKVTDDDMNEIKNVVNNNDDEMITINTKLTNANAYSTSETVVGTWLGKPIYRKVVQYNKTSNGQVDLNLSTYGIENVENIWLNQNSFIKTNNNEWKAVNTYESDSYFTFCTFSSANSFRLSSNSSYARGLWNLIIEYTKTTDV